LAWESPPLAILLQLQEGDSCTQSDTLVQNHVDLLQAPSAKMRSHLDAILLIILEVLVDKPYDTMVEVVPELHRVSVAPPLQLVAADFLRQLHCIWV
jgi:hypothetical protein